MPAPTTPIGEAARRLVARSCRSQGIPEQISDSATLDQVALILADHAEHAVTAPAL